MSDPVADAYDANAALYASMFLRELDNDDQSRRGLADFAEAVPRGGLVFDVGCGPGSTVDHLVGVGVDVVGIDVSRGQIEQARLAFPDHRFEVGELTSLDVADASLGGLVSRYSIIHLDPGSLPAVFVEWRRALADGAPLFLSFFGARTPAGHAEPFDHKVVTAFALWPAAIERQLAAAGFDVVKVEATPLPPGGRPYDHVVMVASAGSE